MLSCSEGGYSRTGKFLVVVPISCPLAWVGPLGRRQAAVAGAERLQGLSSRAGTHAMELQVLQRWRMVESPLPSLPSLEGKLPHPSLPCQLQLARRGDLDACER